MPPAPASVLSASRGASWKVGLSLPQAAANASTAQPSQASVGRCMGSLIIILLRDAGQGQNQLVEGELPLVVLAGKLELAGDGRLLELDQELEAGAGAPGVLAGRGDVEDAAVRSQDLAAISL